MHETHSGVNRGVMSREGSAAEIDRPEFHPSLLIRAGCFRLSTNAASEEPIEYERVTQQKTT